MAPDWPARCSAETPDCRTETPSSSSETHTSHSAAARSLPATPPRAIDATASAVAPQALHKGTPRPASAERRSPSPCTTPPPQTKVPPPTASGLSLAARTPAPTRCRWPQRCRHAPACSGQTRWDKGRSAPPSRTPRWPRRQALSPAAKPPAAPAPPPSAPPPWSPRDRSRKPSTTTPDRCSAAEDGHWKLW